MVLPGELPTVDCVLVLTREALEIKEEKEQKDVLEPHKGFSDNPSFLPIDVSYLLAKQSFLQEKFFPG